MTRHIGHIDAVLNRPFRVPRNVRYAEYLYHYSRGYRQINGRAYVHTTEQEAA